MITTEGLSGFHRHLRDYGRSTRTADLYLDHLRACSRDDSIIARLTNDDLAPKTRHAVRAALLSWAEYTEDDELKKQVKRVKLPPARRVSTKPPLPKKQWRKLIDTIVVDTPARAHIKLMAARGFRSGDILRLKRAEVVDALDSGLLSYVAKGNRRLVFPVSEIWREPLVVLADEKGWTRVHGLICPDAAKPVTASERKIQRELRRCAQKAGIKTPINPHLLRHTYATYYYEECRDPVKLKDHMQWASIETAMGYVAASNRDALEDIASSMFSD